MFFLFDESTYKNNFGTGKRYPGLQLYHDEKTKIPICWAASQNACMSGEILTLMFKQMDKLGISKHGIDEIGKPFYPSMIIDGHPSQMNPDLLTYLNDKPTKWIVALGCPYGTSKWQLHDDKAHNRTFKTALRTSKKNMYEKKKLHSLPIMVRPDEIVIAVKTAV